jgi:gliding motility-associated-like protein
MRIQALVLALLTTTIHLQGQVCTTRGQLPSTAFPVCGSMVFKQSTVPVCETRSIPVPNCENDGLNYTDKNPFWYKFTCYVSGTLGFVIRPNNLDDDYDWQLFDITGRNPEDVYTDKSLVVAGNWSGTSGQTGTNAQGTPFMVCGSQGNDGKPTFTAMPNLVAGRQYLLLVSHFTDSQSGYDLEFAGGNAVITDPHPPKPDKAWAGCGGVTVTVRLDKKLLCSSLAGNGSDFTISPLPPGMRIVSAVSSRCNNSFDMDTVMLQMSGALPPGTYTVNVKRGTDNNTLLDECNKEVPAGSNIPFNVLPVPYTPMDSIRPARCAPDFVELVFQKPMWCGSIAPNGSDFRITGPTAVNVIRASGNCVNGLSSTIKIELAGPIQTGGIYTVELLRGTDGNTIEDECRQETPAGSQITFLTKDTVNADFNYAIRWGCKEDTVDFSYAPRNGVNLWRWNFDNISGSGQQNPVFIFKTFGWKKINLLVSNGLCSATKDTLVHLDNELDARFQMPDVLCPEDAITFKDASIGKIQGWEWDFDNGFRSSAPDPLPQRYPKIITGRSKFHFVKLVVKNDLGCLDTLVKKLQVVYSCYIAVPNAFTPNNDHNNDYLYPLNAWKATRLEFSVYNRYGQLIFRSTDWTKKWDGTFNGTPQPSGAYVWTLKYTDGDSGQQLFQKGTTLLVR